jgi:hypothetical protein
VDPKSIIVKAQFAPSHDKAEHQLTHHRIPNKRALMELTIIRCGVKQVKATTYPSSGKVPGGPKGDAGIRINIVAKAKYPRTFAPCQLKLIEGQNSEFVYSQ